MKVPRRIEKLLSSLDTFEFRPRPYDVGQKTVNVAVDLGYVVSRKSRATLKLADLHRITINGQAALNEFHQVN